MADETPTVHQAWSLVMEQVQTIRKTGRNNDQHYNFRGIDEVLSAVGPALRAHNVTVIPTAESVEMERYQTKSGALMQGVIVKMRYTVYGPAGDSFAGSAYGQAADSGDKSIPKAESVAYRVFLLQALTVPTDDPDPDQYSHERALDQPVNQENPVFAVRRRLLELAGSRGLPFIEAALQARGTSTDKATLAQLQQLRAEWERELAGMTAAENDPQPDAKGFENAE